MLFTLLLASTLTLADDGDYWYCQEYWQTSNCMTACDTRMAVSPCGSGEWCRCGYCEKVWNTARATCATVWYLSDCDSDECCDYSQATCVDIDSWDGYSTSSSSPMLSDGVLEADSEHWGSDAWTGSAATADTSPTGGAAEPATTEATKTGSKALPTILVLSAIALLGVVGFVGLRYHKSKRETDELQKRMAATVYGTEQGAYKMESVSVKA